jgi:class 3 adenylate cyclase
MQTFFSLIDYLNGAPPEERPAIEKMIWRSFGGDRAVLALDMSHFSLSVRRHGILYYLGMIRRMHLHTQPIVLAHRGHVVKYVADNMMAVFEQTRDAVAAALEIHRTLRAAPAPEGSESITTAIGIDYGKLLLIGGEDCFGDPVNVAYKLGEEIARPGEVLISANARGQLGESPGYALREQSLSVSGLGLVAYSVEQEN